MANVYSLSHRHSLPPSEVTELIGGKAANLAVMANGLGLPVPPGFVITTDTCRRYLDGEWQEDLDTEIRDHLDHIEEVVGRRFGDAIDPLLVSVRSGAPVSMPGMMDTILNLGLNDETVAGLGNASQDQDFAHACRDRFQESYRVVVGCHAPDDPWQQLRGAIEAVFRSWNSERARSYRTREGISDDLCTAVIVQAMVYGNRSDESATGVLFTRNPATGDPALYGDVLFGAQGEDVVAGTHQTEPVTVLDERMPEIAAELREYAAVLESHYADVCDIEFTIEERRLWMLQTRIGKRSPQAALRIAIDMAKDVGFPLTRTEAVERVVHLLTHPPTTTSISDLDAPVIASGLGASPGLASGEIATTPEAAVRMAEAGRNVVLVRRETSPNDVHGMARSSGILTSTGGLASHAAVVARGWGIPAVVGASSVKVEGESVVIGERRYDAGDVLTIDGSSGDVFEGALLGRAEIVPEASTLLSWAVDLGIALPVSDEGLGVLDGPGATTMNSDEASADGVLRTLLVKGFATIDDLANALSSVPEELHLIIRDLETGGQVRRVGEMFQLVDDGCVVAAELIESDRQAWGPDNAEDALEAFIPFDARMKMVVTEWQMREFNGQQIINDHTDAAYDATVLARFGSLHEETSAWHLTAVAGLPRLQTYAQRLEHAMSEIDGGDTAYLASPRVDSYHSVWFELHEDLILLAGRTREEETAAGRA